MADDRSRIEELENQLKHLDEMNRWTLESLAMVTSLGDFQSSSQSEQTVTKILKITGERIKRLIDLESLAFFSIDDSDQSFRPAYTDPLSQTDPIQKEADRLIQNGTFAWAIHQNRATVVPSESLDQTAILHPLATKNRIRGIFIGFLKDDGRHIYDASLHLLSIVLLNSANAIESFELYELFRGKNKSLEEAVAERTKELEAARELAETANRTKSEFLSNMNHELRSPLNAIIGFSDVLLIESADRNTSDLAGKIKKSGQYLTQLIEDLLDFDRIETGKVRLDHQRTDINHLVASTLEIQQGQLPKGFTIENRLNPECGELSCDPTRIKQVLTNLIDNAIKYSPNGGTILVKTEPAEAEIHISVQDEGIGIPDGETDSIFERFRQLEGGYTRRGGGLGIGLSLVHNLISLHQGRIWVESEVGKGSTFTFALPKSDETPSTPRAPAKETAVSLDDTPWKDKSVLIVDDIQQYHELMRIFLRDAKKIFSAYDGQEALEMCAREKPDLILLDLRMPVMDGFETLKHLKYDKSLRSIPVLSISAQSLREDKERSLRLGAAAFITKPFEMATLQEAVRKIFS